MKRAIYLKTNSDNEYAYRIFDRWLETAFYLSEIYRGERKEDILDIYVLCDSDVVIEKIKKKCTFFQDVVFIKSSRDGEIKEVVDVVCSPMWRNAGYAHFTTFKHARENGYQFFWNIDADDTLFFVDIQNVAIVLKNAEDHAERHQDGKQGPRGGL